MKNNELLVVLTDYTSMWNYSVLGIMIAILAIILFISADKFYQFIFAAILVLVVLLCMILSQYSRNKFKEHVLEYEDDE